MATIALYASKVNNMPSLLENAKGAVQDLKDELFSLRWKCAQVNADICNLEDVVNTVSSATQLQEDKITALDTLKDNITTFADETARIDGDVAERLNQRKDDFYDKYYYLKPECEKTGWEKFCDGCKAVGEWCKEHWKVIVTVVLCIAAVAIIVLSAGTALGALTPLLLMVAKGILIGTVVGGLAGGTASALFGGSFWEGFEDGAFGGAISGAVSGGLGSWLSAGSTAANMGVAAVSEVVSSLLGDIGDLVIAGEKLSFGDVAFNAVFSGILGAGASALGGLLSNQFKINIEGINKGNGSWAHVWASQSTRSLRHGTVVNLKTILKGLGSKTVDELWDSALEPVKSIASQFGCWLKSKYEEKVIGVA